MQAHAAPSSMSLCIGKLVQSHRESNAGCSPSTKGLHRHTVLLIFSCSQELPLWAPSHGVAPQSVFLSTENSPWCGVVGAVRTSMPGPEL